ncbi:thioesterase family protein [Frankia sp. AgB1.9]|uniref:acyl-CoA thioesterase n=1 Tax=unclassified Frankia TaxID=2632575 RepID=UPI0019329008|nr:MULTISPECIES: thioesterase family protein [unclassified Frankia]MBL7491106.1 thioesterase family protein [Frankia sp. AgW1.1]MBL7551615.1 thioesterase family protein [Frankia sp. AgB1.9]MBL7624218.1 thioesterase family protein [Frankia sp. AgB1.8]
MADMTTAAQPAVGDEEADPAAGAEAGRRADLQWLGLDVVDAGADADGVVSTRASVVMAERHLTQLRRMYGGAGLSLVGALIETATERPLRWATAQFVGSPTRGERLDLVAEVLAAGRRTSQVRVTGLVDGRVVLAGLGASGEASSTVADGVVATMPVVPPPEACPPVRLPFPADVSPGFFGLVEMREIDAGPRLRFWIRFAGRPATRPVLLSLVADSVPTMVMAALGDRGSGSSLDNTIRVGAAPDSDWVLVDGTPEQAAGGYGHGSVRLWAPDGSLAGVGSQTAALWHSPPARRPPDAPVTAPEPRSARPAARRHA